jgi:hypothetical protein
MSSQNIITYATFLESFINEFNVWKDILKVWKKVSKVSKLSKLKVKVCCDLRVSNFLIVFE